MFANHLSFIRVITTVLMLIYGAISGNPLDNEEVNANDIHPPVVDTTYGPVKGIYLPEGMQAYLGIPYAKPPVKELRWNPPEEPISWGPDKLEAFQVSPGCPQDCVGKAPDAYCPQQIGENCLYLNIWTPRDANPSSNLPVVLFIHGGGFIEWSASAPGLDGRFVAAMSDVIFVNLNYRLGALGWLKTEGDEGLSGNYGLMDQRAAMKVQENIRNFGGNPEKITLNGQSAGAQSITIHMTNPATDEFFHQVILQSNSFTVPFASITEALRLSTKFATYLNCSPTDTVCLRSRDVDDVIWAQDMRNSLLWFEQFGPVIDGVEITQHPLISFSQGHFQHKSLITGSTSSEAASYIYSLFPAPPPQLGILSFLAAYFGPYYTLPILKEYWGYWSLDIRRLLIELLGDYVGVCSTRNATRSIESFMEKHTYNYILNHTFNDTRFWSHRSDDICETPWFTCHDTDLFFTLFSLTLSGYNYTTSERQLAYQMMTYWANFFHTGNPNNSKWRKKYNDITSVYDSNYDQDNRMIFWHRYSSENGWPSIYFTTPKNNHINDFKRDECDLLDQVGYTGPVGPFQPDEIKSLCNS